MIVVLGPGLEHLLMVPKVFEPLKFGCVISKACIYKFIFYSSYCTKSDDGVYAQHAEQTKDRYILERLCRPEKGTKKVTNAAFEKKMAKQRGNTG